MKKLQADAQSNIRSGAVRPVSTVEYIFQPTEGTNPDPNSNKEQCCTHSYEQERFFESHSVYGQVQQHDQNHHQRLQQLNDEVSNTAATEAKQNFTPYMAKPSHKTNALNQPTAAKPISVAKFLSPQRSHVSQNVKPLFANRNRDKCNKSKKLSSNKTSTVVMFPADARVSRQNSISVKNTPHLYNRDLARRKNTSRHAAIDSFARICQRGDFQSDNCLPSGVHSISDKQPATNINCQETSSKELQQNQTPSAKQATRIQPVHHRRPAKLNILGQSMSNAEGSPSFDSEDKSGLPQSLLIQNFSFNGRSTDHFNGSVSAISGAGTCGAGQAAASNGAFEIKVRQLSRSPNCNEEGNPASQDQIMMGVGFSCEDQQKTRSTTNCVQSDDQNTKTSRSRNQNIIYSSQEEHERADDIGLDAGSKAIEDGNVDFSQLLPHESVAQELPLNHKKSKVAQVNRNRGIVSLSCAATTSHQKKKERVSRKERMNQRQISRAESNNNTSVAPIMMMQKNVAASVTPTSQSSFCSPQGTLNNAFSAQAALKFHQDKAKSIQLQTQSQEFVQFQNGSREVQSHFLQDEGHIEAIISPNFSAEGSTNGSSKATAKIEVKANQTSQVEKYFQYQPTAASRVQYTRITGKQSPDVAWNQSYLQSVLQQKRKGSVKKNMLTQGDLLQVPKTTVQQSTQQSNIQHTKSNSISTRTILNSQSMTKNTKAAFQMHSPHFSVKNYFEVKQIYQQKSQDTAGEISSKQVEQAYVSRIARKNSKCAKKSQNQDILSQDSGKNHANSYTLMGKKRRLSRAHAIQVPSPLESQPASALKQREQEAVHISHKKRRSCDDKSTKGLVSAGLGSRIISPPTQDIAPGNYMTQIAAPIVIAPVKQCQLNKGFRKMLKKSRSSTKFSTMSRVTLSEVKTNDREADRKIKVDQAGEESPAQDLQEVRINIDTTAKNSLFEHSSKLLRSDQIPLTEAFNITTSNARTKASQQYYSHKQSDDFEAQLQAKQETREGTSANYFTTSGDDTFSPFELTSAEARDSRTAFLQQERTSIGLESYQADTTPIVPRSGTSHIAPQELFKYSFGIISNEQQVQKEVGRQNTLKSNLNSGKTSSSVSVLET